MATSRLSSQGQTNTVPQSGVGAIGLEGTKARLAEGSLPRAAQVAETSRTPLYSFEDVAKAEHLGLYGASYESSALVNARRSLDAVEIAPEVSLTDKLILLTVRTL